MSRLAAAFRRWRYWESPNVPFERLIELDMTARPPYAYGVHYGALLAKRLGHERVSVVECGVAGGHGLLCLEQAAARVEREVGVHIEITGFDLGSGLPEPASPRDLPYWWRKGFYRMDEAALRARLRRSRLVLGPLAETVPRFLEDATAAPVAFVALDVDYHSSTLDALALFDGPPELRLPRCILYLDDTVGGPWEMYGTEIGMLRAVEDFNAAHPHKKIVQNRNLVATATRPWHHQIFYLHDFRHPAYGTYVGGEEQETAIRNLAL